MKNLRTIAAALPLACSVFLFLEGMNPREAKAEFVGSLHSGQNRYVDYTLSPGNYVLNASAFLGDVNIKIYDSTRRTVLLEAPNRFGNETLEFTVPSGGGGTYSIQYSMFACVNPLGACPVTVEILSR